MPAIFALLSASPDDIRHPHDVLVVLLARVSHHLRFDLQPQIHVYGAEPAGEITRSSTIYPVPSRLQSGTWDLRYIVPSGGDCAPGALRPLLPSPPPIARRLDAIQLRVWPGHLLPAPTGPEPSS